VTHANAKSLFDHRRNKSDDVIKALAQSGGVIGCAAYRNITGDHYCSSVEAWGEMVARTVDIAGIDAVAIGTDRSHNTTVKDLDWMRMGRWTRGVDYGAAPAGKVGKAAPADWFQNIEDLGRIPDGLKAAGFDGEEIEKITWKNWMRLYDATFSASA
jgi:membrane dipeptidase